MGFSHAAVGAMVRSSYHAAEVVAAQCTAMDAHPDNPSALVARLWDLATWGEQARLLHRRLDRHSGVQRIAGVLKHDLDVAPQRPKLRRRQRREIDALERLQSAERALDALASEHDVAVVHPRWLHFHITS